MFLAETLDDLRFKSSIADPDVWMRPAVKSDGEEYYKYILCYVDDVLGISVDPMRLMKGIQKAFKFKNDKIKPPEIYLGAKLEEKELNGWKMWTICAIWHAKNWSRISASQTRPTALPNITVPGWQHPPTPRKIWGSCRWKQCHARN